MEITLTLDDEVVERASALAERRQRTLDELVAGFLRELSEREAAIEAHARRAREHGGHPGPEYRFRREDCYDRSVPE
ncbi:MAG: hypothetical protein HYU66_11370 [Armatimonadetes bacterium]|nr:hypothetical protein [Armatimonadota bacterium]